MRNLQTHRGGGLCAFRVQRHILLKQRVTANCVQFVKQFEVAGTPTTFTEHLLKLDTGVEAVTDCGYCFRQWARVTVLTPRRRQTAAALTLLDSKAWPVRCRPVSVYRLMPPT